MDQNNSRSPLPAFSVSASQSFLRTNIRRVWPILVALTPIVCLPVVTPLMTQRAEAQTFAAAITGTVVDQTGAAIPGAKVEIRNLGTSEVRTLTSDASGLFTASQLAPGQYSLSVTAEGFKAFVTSNITLEGSQRAEFNAKMELGASSTSVQVNASDVSLDTQTANREVTLDAQKIEDLPTSYRNPLYLVHSTAGVVAVRTGLGAYTTDQNQNRFAMNGGRDESSSILVDGASIVAPDLGGAIATPNQDATLEVQIQRTAYDAEFTHTDGGVVSLVTKSGTNELHGSAFEYFRNDHLDANSWDNNNQGIARPLFQRNQFGGSIGGPILKNKLFIFGAYEGLRQGQPGTAVYTVPTALERTGDFSQSVYADGTPVKIYNPFNVVNGERQQFANNIIPTSMLDKVGLAAAALYPLPNVTGQVGGGNNFAATAKVVSNYDKFDIRGDYIINQKNTMFGRITKAWQLNSAAAFFKNPGDSWGGGGENDFRYEIILGETWTPSASWVVNSIVSYGKWTENDYSSSFGHSATELGLPAATVAMFQANAYPEFNIDNYQQIGLSSDNVTPHETDGLQFNISHELSRHSLKFGFLGEIQRLYPASLSSPNFNFGSGLTAGPTPVTQGQDSGNSIASLLLGTGYSGDVAYTTKLDLQQLNFGWYVQDTWRATNRLTVTAGIRHDIQNARTERFNRINNFDPTAVSPIAGVTGLPLTGGLVFATSGNRGLWDAQHTNFDPRISFAYKLTDKLVARAGYGIFNPSVYAESGDAPRSSDGFSSDTSWNSTVGGAGITPLNVVSNPFPDGLVAPTGNTLGLSTLLGQQVHAGLRRHPTPYAQVYSADLQYQVGPNGVIEVGYSGSQGRQLLLGSFSDLNQLPSNYLALGENALNTPVANPFAGVITSGDLSGATIPYWRTLVKYPQFTSVQRLADTPGASSTFNALAVKYNQHFSFGLNALITYQWSKALDNTSENNYWEVGDAIRDVYNLKLDRSISAHDIPQAFVGTIGWDLPFGHGKKYASNMGTLTDAFLGGWKLETIVRLNDGLPLNLTQNNVGYNYAVTRPNITSMAALKQGKRSVNRWFNTDAVTDSSSRTYNADGTVADIFPTIGNAPRYLSNERYVITRDADMALEKTFPLYRESNLQFRAEGYNVSNTPVYAAPDTNRNDSSFGVVTGTKSVGPRTLQLGVRLSF
ncbi:TonB-dependent receptor [Granulicella aggregans]|jgi:hypothetical protein|uniref:TonB-dependent receptor n=1 Tax=Granulicella aggregans TaxID=474949 RepID=UPI0021E06051|nr:TonB-dependent receptor [Granulicella aggregans]